MEKAKSVENIIRVFLSGGTRGTWQDDVIESLRDIPHVKYFDPRHFPQGTSMKEIAETERQWLDLADLVFFYFETSNPSGIGSAFEVGYAVAHGKPVIFADEKQTSHTEWLGVHCTETYESLHDGIAALRSRLQNFGGRR